MDKRFNNNSNNNKTSTSTVKKYKINWNIESIEKRVCIYLEISILVDKGAQEYF